jgi:SpoVK/Ycf46/Vps4 family AAA+-type ATPase
MKLVFQLLCNTIGCLGATNRIDSIDPGLRRPGRFDRELYFPLPGVEERRQILELHSKGWGDPPTLERMAESCAGYSGSDLKALTTEAVIQALKRVYPQIYSSEHKLLLDPDRVKVSHAHNSFQLYYPID